MKTLAELLTEIEGLIIGYAIQLFKTRQEAAQILGISRRNLFSKTSKPGMQKQFGEVSRDLDRATFSEWFERMDELEKIIETVKENLVLIEQEEIKESKK